MYPRISRGNGCCSDQQSLYQLMKVVGENGLEWRAIVRKEHLGGTKRLDVSLRDTHEVTHLGEDEIFTAEVATAIKKMKSGKAAGEDEIRPRDVETADWRRNSLVNASVSSCVETWQNSQRLANRCDYSDIQERRSQAMYKLQRDITP